MRYAALLLACLLRKLPRGDSHRCWCSPASVRTTSPPRRCGFFLDGLGYVRCHPWGQGFNFGPRQGVLEPLHATCGAPTPHARKVSLIGWSLGGLYARELAKELPTTQRDHAGHALRAAACHQRLALTSWSAASPVHDHRCWRSCAAIEPPVLPTTSIWSRSDGIVAWRCSVVAPRTQAENISELHASHVGMGMNPAGAVRGGRPAGPAAGHWKPFEPHGARRWFFRTPHAR